MSETTGQARPSKDAPRADDGYFGPDSVMWKVYADPGLQIGGIAGLLLQALEPGMMTHFSRVTRGYQGARELETAQYLNTSVFGDKAHAKASAERVDRMHEAANWTDPRTGEVHRAKTGSWMRWTQYALTYTQLRATDEFGPELTAEEQDRFVAEQQIACELLHVPGPYFQTRAELEDYIDYEKDTKALSLAAAEVGAALRNPPIKNLLTKAIVVTFENGMLSLLPDWARSLYGVGDHSEKALAKGVAATRKIVEKARKDPSTRKTIEDFVNEATEHPFAKVRAHVSAQPTP
ncbi:MAG: DUF2236 domain-containing protein [Microbacteriaceae bacterium]|nr:DUF2236 domain-containing protein [Microbacteriaceae bacterium]